LAIIFPVAENIQYMKNPENLCDVHVNLGKSKTDKFITSAVISKRFKDYMPSLVSYITVLPAAVKPVI